MSDTQKPTDFWSINPRTLELQRENADLRKALESIRDSTHRTAVQLRAEAHLALEAQRR